MKHSFSTDFTKFPFSTGSWCIKSIPLFCTCVLSKLKCLKRTKLDFYVKDKQSFGFTAWMSKSDLMQSFTRMSSPRPSQHLEIENEKQFFFYLKSLHKLFVHFDVAEVTIIFITTILTIMSKMKIRKIFLQYL